MSLYKTLKTDENIEREGFALTLYDVDDEGQEVEITFLLARAGGANKKFANRMEALLRPYERAIKNKTMSDSKSAELLSRAIAETVILDWNNVEDEEGNDLPFTVENAMKILVDLPELRAIILEEAQKVANFIRADQEENSGNSESTSAGA